MNNVKLFKNQILIVGICVLTVVLSLIGGSYAIFTSSSKANEYNSLTVGDLEVSYVDKGDGYGDILSLNGAYPMSNADGAATKPYRFSVENKGNIPIDFRIKIANDEEIMKIDGCDAKDSNGNYTQILSPEYIMVKLDNNDPVQLSTLASSDYTIYTKSNLAAGEFDRLATELVPGSSEIHEIRIWIKNDAPNSVLGKHFHGKVIIETNQAGIDDSLLKTYHIGDSVTLVDNSKWHVIREARDSDATVTLISDYNLNSDGEFCTTGTCSTYPFDRVTENAGLITPSRTTLANSYCTNQNNGCNMYRKNGTTVVTDSTIKTWLEQTYLPILQSKITASGVEGVTLEDLTVELPTMEDLAKADNKTFNQHIITFDQTYLKNTTYWTQTASNISASSVWYINSTDGKSAVKSAKDELGIRVVITTSKSNLK